MVKKLLIQVLIQKGNRVYLTTNFMRHLTTP